MNRLRKGLSWILLLAIILTFLPGTALASVSQEMQPYAAAAEDELRNLIAAAPDGGTIKLTGSVILTRPLVIEKNLTIISDGATRKIMASIKDVDGKSPWSTGASTAGNGTMIQVHNATLTLGNGITIDAMQQCRAISANMVPDAGLVNRAPGLVLNGCTITGGKSNQPGAGVWITDNGTLEAYGGARLENNEGIYNTASSGGALYVGNGVSATLKDVHFIGNKAHSGGAIYVFRGTVTCTEETEFSNNEADQRGGAIHSHGLVVLNGTSQITGNHSNQYGGAIYISASASDVGKVVLNGGTISGNTAGNGGAGIYVADQGEVYVGNGVTVSGNNLPTTSSVPSIYRTNNIQVGSGTSRVIAYSNTGPIGISTSNPYYPQVVVYSTSAVNGIVQFPTGASFFVDPSYTLTGKGQFSYDSEVWVLKDATDDPEAPTLNETCIPGNLWMGINPDYGNSDTSANQIFFDINLPGKRVIHFPNLTVGETQEVPAISNESMGKVTYKFKGWYTEPSGGSQVPSPVPVEAGTKVYYAQWEVVVDDNQGETPGKPDMYLVYFDKN